MRALVTGVAGFIGSHLAEALARRGEDVIGVDCFSPYYAAAAKQMNLRVLSAASTFRFEERDLLTCALDDLLDGVTHVFHQAAQPGVRASWATGFPTYVEQNVLVTQRLLEALRDHPPDRFVYASSSSVYGQAEGERTSEDDIPRPHSPYGVTKLAAEHLCGLYASNWGIPTVSLRYFTVFGPRQRPDMAMHRLIEAGIHGTTFPMYGDGSQERDFTFVSDVVAANLAAADQDVSPGTVVNIAGGTVVTMKQVLKELEAALGTDLQIEHLAAQPGDVRRTSAATDRAQKVLGWRPKVSLETGLGEQVAWHRSRLHVK